MTTRIAMGVEYDGANYLGWQSQAFGDTVQQRLELAISKVANHPVSVICAGRTDTGVHGIGQVIHFDTPSERPVRGWHLGTNVNLPKDIGINWVRPVSGEFHARFSAVRRSYSYRILNRYTRSALWRDRAVWLHRPLDAERMRQAALPLLGRHDFTSYRALACQAKSPVRTLQRLEVRREGEFVVIDATADGFLHHMVRNLAGVLIAIGVGDRPVEWAEEVLNHRDRTLGGVTAPPQGLYLTAVEYPEEFEIPSPMVPLGA